MSAWSIFPYFLGLVVGGMIVATMTHEGGRLLCARIGSIPVRRLVIGCGPVLVRGYTRNARVELRLLPIGSLVICAESTNKLKRWAVALYFLGGILGNLGVIGVIVRLLGRRSLKAQGKLSLPRRRIQLRLQRRL